MKELEKAIREAEKIIRAAMENHEGEMPMGYWASLTVYSDYASYFHVCDRNGTESPITMTEGWINENDEEVSEIA